MMDEPVRSEEHDRLARLRAGDFEGRCREEIRLDLDAGSSVALVLVEVSVLGRGVRRQTDRPPYSLVFRAPAGVRLPRATRRFVHPELGRLPLFLVPIAADEEGVRYEAAFR